MANWLDGLPAGARVLVVRLRSLGDAVLTTPALALLRAYRPDLEIGVVIEPRFAGVYEDNPDVSRIVMPSVGEVVGFRARLTLNLHGGTRSALLTAASLARWRAGFGHFRAQWLYNIRIPRAQEILGEERVIHTAEHVASAMFYLGVPRTEIPRARLVAPPGQRRAGNYAVIHPTASAAHKAWPAERFAQLGAVLRGSGLEPVFIGAAGDDLSTFEGFSVIRGASLAEIKTLLAGARLFVGNDSGPAHMAAAFALPVVVLYGASDARIWAPWRTRSETIVSPEGLDKVSLDQVIHAVEQFA
jgi:ADP-heptose:LPS heptosyltransferase